MSSGDNFSAKRALIAIRELQARLDTLENERSEAIAIIGMGCRFPGGADNPESLWRLLRDGVDAVTEVPRDRWDVDAYYDPDPSSPGKMVTRWGGFLANIDRFDPAFFGISPREAASLDPQQRLLLEVAWEALEDAGVAPGRLAGTRTGVFVGLYNNDYAQLQLSSAEADAHVALGSSLGIAPGRLSYLLDLSGPSLVIDTLCSSSLVALHLACGSLRAQECNLAIVGGVNLILSPLSTILTSRLLALAPDGRCKTFDALANGFVRGEGCGAVVLKRLSNALADGDPIWAVVRGSAVNQDGRSTGLTAPNALAQRAVITQALANGGIDPQAVGYIEAHGTGTPLGDPIEVDALRAVFARSSLSMPECALGSVKTNLGHLEAAAGIAGLMKAVLAVRHGMIPPHLHLRQLNPRISLEGTPFVIPKSVSPWPGGDRRRIAGVSSFGMSGTNAHIVIEQAPPRAAAPASSRPFLLPLSARTEPALREMSERYATYLQVQPEAEFDQVCYTAQTGRDAFEHRIAVVAGEPLDAVARLGAAVPSRRRLSPKLAFLFTGQGAQYAGMGRELAEGEPVFRAALDQCAEILRGLVDVPLDSLLVDATERLHQTAYTQAALFALEWSLSQVWMAWNVKPDYVLGHSVGEYVAACVAGAFSLADGLTLVARRGLLMQSLPHGGAMSSIHALESNVAAAVAASGHNVSIAAVNAPRRIVVSGAQEAVDAVCANFSETRRLNVSHAFHSELMSPILDEFERLAAQLEMRPLAIPLISNVTGNVVPAGTKLDTAYWRRHLRQPVQFQRGIKTLAELGCNLYLEIGPHPVLTALGQQCLEDSDAVWVPSLRQGQADRTIMLNSMGQLWAAGLNPDWKKLYPAGMVRRASLPTYPFQRDRCWIAHGGTTLLGSRVRFAAADTVFESRLSVEALPWLGDHRVRGEAVLPGAAIVSLAREASKHSCGVVSDLVFREPLIIPERRPVTTQFVVAPAGTFKLCSLDGERWRVHAEGTVQAGGGGQNVGDLEAIRKHCRDEVVPEPFYDALAAQGLACGPQFQSLRQIWRDGTHAVARIGPVNGETSIVDACLQLLGLTLFLDRPGSLFLPFSIAHLEWRRDAPKSGWAHAQLQETSGGDVALYDLDGQLVLSMRGVAFAGQSVSGWLQRIEWEAQPLPSPAVVGEKEHWLVVGDEGGLASQLNALGHEVKVVERGADFASLDLQCDGVVYVAAAEEVAEQSLVAPLRLTQAVLRQAKMPRLWWVTHGEMEQQPLWGFALTLAREHPELPRRFSISIRRCRRRHPCRRCWHACLPAGRALHKKSKSTRLVSDPLPVASLQRLSPFVRGTMSRLKMLGLVSPLRRGTAAGAKRPAGGRSQAVLTSTFSVRSYCCAAACSRWRERVGESGQRRRAAGGWVCRRAHRANSISCIWRRGCGGSRVSGKSRSGWKRRA
jgi:acyl transferase domain-containing protein